ncbi:hypothetical protein [Rickettsia endosymbiont of Polydrusus tereticollis]|uniref:hypothetical protein n=1 Tax=Rickettsia endosymbiont of Polydrusus tereticollis TaxID=3066251 RepID=UPI0031334802
MKVQHYSPHNSNPNSPKSNQASLTTFGSVVESYTIALKKLESDQKPIEINNLAKYFKGDEDGNCYISKQVADGNLDEIKTILHLEGKEEREILRELAFKMCDPPYREKGGIENQVATGIFVDATDQLDRLGENTTDLFNSYDIPY